MDKRCGTCHFWQPPEKYTVTKLGTCPLKSKGIEKYPEEKPVSWCWIKASSDQLASRLKAGLIGGDDVNG